MPQHGGRLLSDDSVSASTPQALFPQAVYPTAMMTLTLSSSSSNPKTDGVTGLRISW